MDSSLQHFEDQYWETSDQPEVFRHRQALAWLTLRDAPVVDIGCGDGFFLRRLREHAIPAWGIDVSPKAIEKCREQALVAEQGDFTLGDIPNQLAQTAVLLDVLEHLYDPAPLLHALRRRVQTLIISVPNFVSLPARYQVACGRVPENNTPRKGHVYWYTQRVLEKRLQEAGWKITDQAMNSIWEGRPLLGRLMKALARRFPSVFSLSLMVRAEHLVSGETTGRRG